MLETPYGLCECGCGEKTMIAKGNDKKRGWAKGEPRRFRPGHGSGPHNPNFRPPKHGPPAETQLKRMYVDEEMTAKQIAGALGVDTNTVYAALRRYGVPRRSRAHALAVHRGAPPLNLEVAAGMYRKGATLHDIALEFRTSETTVSNQLKKYGVKIRSYAEASRMRRNVAKRRRPPASHLRGVRECVICADDKGLEMHHVNGIRTDDRPENLIWLCWEHHAVVEYLVNQAVIGLQSHEAGFVTPITRRALRESRRSPTKGCKRSVTEG